MREGRGLTNQANFLQGQGFIKTQIFVSLLQLLKISNELSRIEIPLSQGI